MRDRPFCNGIRQLLRRDDRVEMPALTSRVAKLDQLPEPVVCRTPGDPVHRYLLVWGELTCQRI